MNRSCLALATLAFATVTIFSARAEEPLKTDRVTVKVEGSLGSLIRLTDGRGLASASVLAGGGELFLDCDQSKSARDKLKQLADRLVKPRSSVVILPRVSIQGHLEFRKLKVADQDGELEDEPASWILVVDSLKVVSDQAKAE